MVASQRCPHCGTPSPADAFQCPRCLLLLNPESISDGLKVAEERRAAPSVVRSLVGPAQHVLVPEIPEPQPQARVDGEITAPYTIPIDETSIPRVLADVDLMLSPLHPFEAYVLTFLDGTTSVGQVAKHARLPEIEVQVVLNSLLERNLIEVAESVPVAAPARRTTPLPHPAVRRPDSVLQQAIVEERRGNLAGAIQVLESGIARLPGAAALYNKLALVIAAQGVDLRKAEQLLRKALELDPGNSVFQQNLRKIAERMASSVGPASSGSVVLGRLRKK